MHDLIHDLAQFIAGDMFFDEERMLEVDQKSKLNLEKVRHLSFFPKDCEVSKRFEYLRKMKSSRTFHPYTTPLRVGVRNYIYIYIYIRCGGA